MKTKKTKSKSFYKKIGIKYYIPAVILLLVGIFYLTPAKGIVAQKLLIKGNHYFNGGAYDLEKAAKWYKAAAFVNRKSSTAHYQLGRIYFVQNNLEKAMKEMNTALAINPNNKRIYYMRGLVNGYAKKYKEAQSDFKEFIRFAPKEWAGYNDLAWAYYEDENYQNAADAALEGLAVIPENSWLLNGLGTAYLGLGEKDKAKEAFSKAIELSGELTASQWARAYPGNNPDDAPWDLAQFKTDIKTNLSAASEESNSSKKAGVFKPACCSAGGACNYFCSGSQCVPDDGTYEPMRSYMAGTVCDPDDLNDNMSTGRCAPMYGPFASCDACYASLASIWWQFTGTHSCTSNADCAPPPYCGDGSCNNGETCSTCPGDCGACAVNHSPTVSIVSPSAGSTQDPAGTIFSINVQDQDNNTLTVTASTLSCTGSVNPLLNRTATNTSSVQNISATLGSLPTGVSCTWNVTVNDGSLQTSASVTFQTQAAGPSCSVSCSPSSLVILPGGSASFTPTCSGSSCAGFTVNSCSITSDTSGGKIHINRSGNTCNITTDSNVSFTDRATANAATTCTACPADVNITIKRLWTETNP